MNYTVILKKNKGSINVLGSKVKLVVCWRDLYNYHLIHVPIRNMIEHNGGGALIYSVFLRGGSGACKGGDYRRKV